MPTIPASTHAPDAAIPTAAEAETCDHPTRRRRVERSERGEGVISAAIAVLIISFLGAAMYLTYSRVLNKAGSKTDAQVCQIGSDPAAGATPTAC